MNRIMTNMKDNSILWTAPDFTLPEILWKRLEGMGYRVLLADDSVNIKDRIESISPRIWVRQINGESEAHLSQLQEIKRHFPHLPVILMSKQPDIDDAVMAIKSGASDYLTGNISTDRLWAVIEGALKYPQPVNISRTRGTAKGPAGSKLVAVHASMLKLMEMAGKIAPSRSTVLIKGETGVGKEIMARFIHDKSDRRNNRWGN